MYLVISLMAFEGRMWDLIVSVPDHCLSFYFTQYLFDRLKLYAGQKVNLPVLSDSPAVFA